MKKILLLVLSLGLLFTSCEKDSLVFSEAEADGLLKSAELKMVPVKAEIQSTVTEYYEGVPVVGTLSGTMSHIGKLNTEESIWHTTSLSFDETTGTITWEMIGNSCASNGDLLHYTLTGTFSISENQLNAHVDMNGGTGRFEFAEGYMDVTGYADDPLAITTMFMTGDGLISSVGSSK